MLKKIFLFLIIANCCFGAGGGTQNAEIKPIQKAIQVVVQKVVNDKVKKIENNEQPNASQIIDSKVSNQVNDKETAAENGTEVLQQNVQNSQVKNIEQIAEKAVQKVIEEKVLPKLADKVQPVQMEKVIPKENVNLQTIKFGKEDIPADYRSIKILGATVVPRDVAVNFVLRNANKAKLNCSVRDIVNFYYDEAEIEGVRPDLALCQAIVETGFFGFGGTVSPMQNNFCGLGTTGNGVKGAKFATAQEGVRAHIQHLLAYCQKSAPKQKVVDPRYDMVHKIRLSKGLITNWFGLNGTWAMSANYSEKIMTQYVAMLKNR